MTFLVFNFSVFDSKASVARSLLIDAHCQFVESQLEIAFLVSHIFVWDCVVYSQCCPPS